MTGQEKQLVALRWPPSPRRRSEWEEMTREHGKVTINGFSSPISYEGRARDTIYIADTQSSY